LQQIFQNLVSNAIKYRGSRPPRVPIEAMRQEGVWKFSVRDNGIGIEPRYKEQVFGLFNQCRVWVESKPGEGSIFFFTLAES
jgi:signal transduction histidine kinase